MARCPAVRHVSRKPLNLIEVSSLHGQLHQHGIIHMVKKSQSKLRLRISPPSVSSRSVRGVEPSTLDSTCAVGGWVGGWVGGIVPIMSSPSRLKTFLTGCDCHGIEFTRRSLVQY